MAAKNGGGRREGMCSPCITRRKSTARFTVYLVQTPTNDLGTFVVVRLLNHCRSHRGRVDSDAAEPKNTAVILVRLMNVPWAWGDGRGDDDDDDNIIQRQTSFSLKNLLIFVSFRINNMLITLKESNFKSLLLTSVQEKHNPWICYVWGPQQILFFFFS